MSSLLRPFFGTEWSSPSPKLPARTASSLANDAANGAHQRGLYVLKSRGMAHSNQVREFVLTAQGLEVLDAARAAGVVRRTPTHPLKGRDEKVER